MATVDEESNKNHIPVNPDPNAIYRPSLHRVKCQGFFHVHKTANSDSSSVLCKGIQSRFETIHEFPPMKPAAALQSFQRSTQQLEDDEYHSDFLETGTRKSLPIVIDPKWNELMDTMKEHSNIKVDSFEKDIESDAKFYGTSNCYFLSLKPYHDEHYPLNSQHQAMTESHDILRRKDIQGLRSYRTIKRGSIFTDIEDGNQKQQPLEDSPQKSIIYAISPSHDFGVAKRRVQNKHEGLSCSSTTIKLGVLEIQIASFEESEESIVPENVDSNSSGITKSSTESKAFEKPSTLEITNFLKRVDMMSHKIQNHMYKNVLLVKEELENDFFNRTLKGAKAVTLRMKKTASDIVHFFNQK